MVRKIKLSRRTERKLEILLEYLEKEWSIKIKNEFIKKLDKIFHQIIINPQNFPQSHKIKGIHKCVITKQTTIYYKYDDKAVYVITLFDNRQDPKKLNNELDN